MHKYELHQRFICPMDKKCIHYKISLTSAYMILVEDIQGFFAGYETEALQEQLVDDLKNEFPMAAVCVVATHNNVKITSRK
tara:strand:+ start:957 stop:1199 length:243 start_codon:yes stop_codon:yes gene_type:complete